MIRIMLVEDNEYVRRGMAELIGRETDFEVAGEASDGQAAVDLVPTVLPDVVIMDISMPGMDGIQATRIIKKKFKRVCIIGVSVHVEEVYKAAMLEAGAVGFFSKNMNVRELFSKIRECKPE